MPTLTDGAGGLLGIDLGTTELRVGLLALDGRLLGAGSAAYPTDRGDDGRAEQDPGRWWEALEAATRAALAAAGGGIGVAAICGVGQGPTIALLDEAGRPVRPAITWQDRRVAATGFGLLPRLAWVAAADPGAVARARWAATAWDALGFHLTGVAATSLQAHERALEPAELRAAGLDPALVPPPLPVGARLGGLRPELADRLGLAPGIPVIAGVNDGTASMLGAGLLEPGEAVDTGGASGGIGIYAAAPVDLPGTFVAPAPIEGRWVLGGAMAATGAALDWLAGSILGGVPLETLLAEAAPVPAGAGGLVFLPYLAGERAPIFDDAARGAFVGLTLDHGRAHLARAVLEAAALALRHVAEPIRAAGVPLVELRLAGRPARSDLWARIKADVLGVPVALLGSGETAVVGAAVLAASGAGLAPTLEAAVRRLVRVERRIAPDPATAAVYEARYRVYRDLYPALRESMAALGG
jgi:xylulokinase